MIVDDVRIDLALPVRLFCKFDRVLKSIMHIPQLTVGPELIKIRDELKVKINNSPLLFKRDFLVVFPAPCEAWVQAIIFTLVSRDLVLTADKGAQEICGLRRAAGVERHVGHRILRKIAQIVLRCNARGRIVRVADVNQTFLRSAAHFREIVCKTGR